MLKGIKKFGWLSSLIILWVSCGESNVEELTKGAKLLELGSPELHPWVQSVTQGELDPEGAIEVYLGHDGQVWLDSLLGSDLSHQFDECPLKISPAVNLKCTASQGTIRAQAPEGFLSQTTYDIALDLSIFNSLDADYLRWQLRVPARDFQVKMSQLVSWKDGLGYILKGEVVTSTQVKLNEMKQYLKVAGSQAPTIKWVSQDSIAKSFHFEINQLPSKAKDYQMTLWMDANSFDRSEDWYYEVTIPKKKQFDLLSYQWVSGSQGHVLLNFSQPIDPKQSLSGLIQVRGKKEIVRLGSQVKIFGNFNYSSNLKIKIAKSIKDIHGNQFQTDRNLEVQKAARKPKLTIKSSGTLLPTRTESSKIYFQAQGLKSIQVRIFEVRPENLSQHMQINHLEGNREFHRTAELVYNQELDLKSLDPSMPLHYGLDIDTMIQAKQGSLLQFQLSFNPKQIYYHCEDSTFINDYVVPEEHQESSYWDYSQYGSWWQNKNNPCHPSYYQNKSKVHKNLIHTDLSIIAKTSNKKSLWISVRDILSGKPIQGAQVNVKNFQGRTLQTLKTDNQGQVDLKSHQEAYLVEVVKGNDRNLLKLKNNHMLSTSHFDIQGSQVKEGIKIYQYGERGVWRPGDTLYLSAILYDPLGQLPPGLTLKSELRNPRSNQVADTILQGGLNGFYHWKIATDPLSETGTYQWNLRFGGRKFSKRVKIAAIKPNKLKVNLKFMDSQGETKLHTVQEGDSIELFSRYLHGAQASRLKARLYLTTQSTLTKLPKASGYQFDDVVRKYSQDKKQIWSGQLDAKGQRILTLKLPPMEEAPGQLKAKFEAEVSESGGQSVRYETRTIHPYEHYVGIKLPPGDAARNMLLTDQVHQVEVIGRTPQGQASQLNQVEMKFYKLEWKWWWLKESESSVNFLNAQSTKLLKEEIISVQGKSTWNIEVKHPDWGRYLVRACDLEGGHCSSKVVYIDWPGWAGRAQDQEVSGPQVLAFSSDKKSYTVGETLQLNVPAAGEGYFWVSLENGSQVLKNFWTQAKPGANKISMTLPEHSSPNAYVSVLYIQPSVNRQNDLPLRMYGVIPVEINDSSIQITPQLHHQDVFKPNTTVPIKVSEKDGQAMTYTLAMVDEGLLDLTNFKTPNPLDEFNKKQTLGIRTYDLYDEVIGAYTGNLDQLLSIGGGGNQQSNESVKRFKPMVQYLGPYHLAAGQTNTHDLNLPSYVGSVRLMLVAGDPSRGVFGQTESTVPVRQDVMIQGTLPRVIGPQEKVSLALQIFNMSPEAKSIRWKVNPSKEFNPLSQTQGKLRLAAKSDTIIRVPYHVKDFLGKAEVSFEAQSGADVSQDKINLQIRTPLPKSRVVKSQILQPGESLNLRGQVPGYPDQRKMTLSISQGSPLHIEDRIEYLISYPHGCVEQTTSRAFPQLYLNQLMELTPQEKSQITSHIEAAIDGLKRFQTTEGLLSYWAGQSEESDWGSIYAAHFLTEVKRQGYQVENAFYQKLIQGLKRVAKSWRTPKSSKNSSLRIQVYRLFVLALAGEVPQSALNRLYESGQVQGELKWSLAASFYLTGRKDLARQLITKSDEIVGSEGGSKTYGSRMRNQAMLLELMVLLGESTQAFELGEKLTQQMNKSRLYSTQESAWVLKALAQWKAQLGEQTSLEVMMNNQTLKTNKPLLKRRISLNSSGKYDATLTNKMTTPIYLQTLQEYHPDFNSEKVSHEGVKVSQQYTDLQGNTLDPSKLQAGTDVLLKLKVQNLLDHSVKDYALTQYIASGWEFLSQYSKPQGIEYLDQRDDKIHYYFDLKANETLKWEIPLKVSYAGEFYLPGAYVEAMYQPKIQSRLLGQWVKVIP